MIDFHTPDIADRCWAEERLAGNSIRACEYNFTTLLVWAAGYQITIADVEGFLTVRLRGEGGFGYLWPAGNGDLSRILTLLEADAAERGEPFRLLCLLEHEMARLNELRPGQFAFTPHRNSFDYLYEVDKLADLGGRKLHAKRNHCKHFEEENPSWSYSPMTAADLTECMELNDRWDAAGRVREGEEEAEDIFNEKKGILLAFRHFDELGLEGGVLRVDGKVVAFTMANRLTADTFDVHFEKAFGEMQGDYAVINREFARQIRRRHPEVKYLNREDDMGLEGLRRAKESYYPDLMAEKHSAEAVKP